jgi:hypothetical protein
MHVIQLCVSFSWPLHVFSCKILAFVVIEFSYLPFHTTFDRRLKVRLFVRHNGPKTHRWWSTLRLRLRFVRPSKLFVWEGNFSREKVLYLGYESLKVLRGHILKGLFDRPKSSFGEHRIVCVTIITRASMSQHQDDTMPVTNTTEREPTVCALIHAIKVPKSVILLSSSFLVYFFIRAFPEAWQCDFFARHSDFGNVSPTFVGLGRMMIILE